VHDEAGGPEDVPPIGGGTTQFMAPELLSAFVFGKTKYQVSKEADVYAFGMLILQVCLCRSASDHTLKDGVISRC
jgi:hypothetical protein